MPHRMRARAVRALRALLRERAEDAVRAWAKADNDVLDVPSAIRAAVTGRRRK